MKKWGQRRVISFRAFRAARRRVFFKRTRPWLRDSAIVLGAALIAALAFGIPQEHWHKILEPARNVLATHQGAMDKCSGWPRINCVIDGDTIWLNGEKIRLADINAPEISEPKCPAELALGQRATDRLITLLNEGPFEVEKTGDRDKDKYDRALRILTRKGTSLGQTLIAEGLAEPWQGYRGNWCG